MSFLRLPMSLLLILNIFAVCSCTNDSVPADDESVARKDAIHGSRLAWDFSTMTRVSDASFTGYNGYARLITLPDGSLYCVYESNGSVIGTFSTDRGRSWSEPILIAPKEEGINMAVPDVLHLQDGNLLAMYNPRPFNIDPTRRFAIRTKRSLDNGKTWQDERVLYEAGYQFENGCWEPSAVQLPDGKIRLYFANEGVYTSSNEQNISMVSSDDGGLTWSAEPTIISFRPGFRDGMPVPLLLENQIAVAIEDNGSGNFKPSIIFQDQQNPEMVGAESPERISALSQPLNSSVYAGAPYLIAMNDGPSFLSYQGSEGRGTSLAEAVMRVVIGTENATEFGNKTTPFELPPNKNGLWNSISPTDDQTVSALTTTNAYSSNGTTEVWMIQGYLMEEPTISTVALQVDGTKNETVWSNDFPLFIGHKGSSSAHVGIGGDQENVFLYSQVVDEDVHAGKAEVGSSDGVYYYLDFNEATGVAPDSKTWKIFVSAGNLVKVYQGRSGQWQEINLSIQSQSVEEEDGYFQEILIPLSDLNIEYLPKGINVSLKAIGVEGSYEDQLSGADALAPYTWMRIREL